VFHKELNDKLGVSVSQSLVADWHKTNDIISASDFVLKLKVADVGEQGIWTNRHYFLEHAGPLMNVFRVFDVILLDNHLHVCYQNGGRFTVQEISSRWLGPSAASVSRFELARIPIVPGGVVLTNAAFGVLANGTKTLMAQGTGNAVLLWEYQHHEWVLNEEASGPEKVKQRVAAEYEHWTFPLGQ